jgi:hypothetical protein
MNGAISFLGIFVSNFRPQKVEKLKISMLIPKSIGGPATLKFTGVEAKKTFIVSRKLIKFDGKYIAKYIF